MTASKKAVKTKAGSAKSLNVAQLQAVAELFSSLSESSRLRILQALQQEPMSVSELVGHTELKQANVSKQLGILQSADVVTRRQEGNRAIYSIAMPLVFELCDLVCRRVAMRAAERAAALKRRRT